MMTNEATDATSAPTGTALRAIAEGTLNLAGRMLSCYVLDDGRRVLSTSAMTRAFLERVGGAGNGDFERLVRRLTNRYEGLALAPEIEFTLPRGGLARAYPAAMLVDVSVALSRAWSEGKLHGLQQPTVERARALIDAVARVGIEALIDEATGHQAKRPADYLQSRLDVFFREHADGWRRRFRGSLVRELARLHGHSYEAGRYPAFLRSTFARIYALVLGEEVAAALRERNPHPRCGSNHHQHLVQEVQTILERDLDIIEALARQSKTVPEFWERLRIQYLRASALPLAA